MGYRFVVAFLSIAASLLSGCASQVQFPGMPTKPLTANLYRPDKAGRLPAVVLLAPCGGVTPHMGEWARWLKGL